jgi:tetratricopeptide (TPR) repeat protein
MLLNRERCFKCKAERSVRKCPRNLDKLIGWKCCLELRIDLRCPSACPYSAVKSETSPFPSFRADSNTEFTRTAKRHIDLWAYQPLAALDGLSPADYAAKDKANLLAWLGKFQFPANFPMAYLLQKLQLPHENFEEPETPETVVFGFFDAVIAQDWDQLRAFTINDRNDDDLARRYTSLVASVPELKKVDRYEILHAGAADDGVSAMVVLDLGGRSIWAVLLTSAGGRWRIRQNLNGGPHLYYGQNKLFHTLAEHLAQGEADQAWDLIKQNLPLYPDCADLYYYRALYWQLARQFDKAREDLLCALALDNHYFAAGFALSALYLADKELAPAKELLAWLAAERPEDLNVRNNLAACEAGLGNVSAAQAIWRELLKTAPNYEPAIKNLERYPG